MVTALVDEATPRVAYSVAQVAKLLSVSRGTVYAEINAGRLRAHQIRTVTRVSAEALTDYVAEREGEAQALLRHRRGRRP